MASPLSSTPSPSRTSVPTAIGTARVLQWLKSRTVLPIWLAITVAIWYRRHRYRSSLPSLVMEAQSRTRMAAPELAGRSSIIVLSDGRYLCYTEWGTRQSSLPNDTTSIDGVIYLHGLAGSRLEYFGSHDDDRYVITIDRPGYGFSSPLPSSVSHEDRFHQVAKDIMQLADRLKLNRFVTLGWSSGGPYSLACAAYLGPKRCVRVATVAGDAPWGMVPWPTFNKNRIHYFLYFVSTIQLHVPFILPLLLYLRGTLLNTYYPQIDITLVYATIALFHIATYSRYSSIIDANRILLIAYPPMVITIG
jgi:pimeloyl-ACP methyl ester carboxylesterase